MIKSSSLEDDLMSFSFVRGLSYISLPPQFNDLLLVGRVAKMQEGIQIPAVNILGSMHIQEITKKSDRYQRVQDSMQRYNGRSVFCKHHLFGCFLSRSSGIWAAL